MSDHTLTQIRFSSLGLLPELLKGTEAAGFELCTPIQAAALPKALAGEDVEGQAQTGTGKTAAFLLATMNRLLRSQSHSVPADKPENRQPRALILAPTRELAVQIHKDAEVLGRYTNLRMGLVFGGTGYDSQREMLRAGVDVLIGTPGRLIDYHKQRVFSLNSVEVVVLDEADRMFDLGFIKDIRYLLRRVPRPEKRLNMLFSATLSHRVSELAYEHMNNPTVVNASPEQVTVKQVSQVIYHVSKDEKIALLIGLLQRMDATRTIVFVNTKRTAERVHAYLEGNGFPTAMLTGDVPQNQRLKMLAMFTEGKLAILVATDVAARGLHIPDVSHVINFDLPQDAEDYVHRVGRTARAGASGDAISLACEEFVFSLTEIEEFIGQRIESEFAIDELLAVLKPPARIARRSVPARKGPGRQKEAPRKTEGGDKAGGRRRRTRNRQGSGSDRAEQRSVKDL